MGLQVAPRDPFTWRTSREEAGIALFRETEALLRAATLPLAEVRTILFCTGPGSLLGLRLAAIALRTWAALPRPTPLRVFSYHSLALVAADLLAAETRPPFHVLHDARRETWNILSVAADGTFRAIRRCAAPDLPRDAGAWFFPEGFPSWQPLPPAARLVPYPPTSLPALAARFALLQETASPDAFMLEPPSYRTWNAAPIPS